MKSMEYVYTHYLCINLLGKNMCFANAYNLECQNNSMLNEEFTFYYNEEFVEYIRNAISQDNNDFLEYEKIKELYFYIFNIMYINEKNQKLIKSADFIKNFIENRQKNKENEMKELSDYGFEDGRLVKFEINHRNETCKLFLHNVLLYDEKRKEKIYDVEAGDIVLTFREVKDIKLKGTLDFEFLKYNSIYSSDIYKVSEKKHCFVLLCIANDEHFIIEITFCDASSSDFLFDSSKYYT
jgi:hypothetical protein